MAYLLIAILTSVLFILNAIFGSMPGYRIAPVFLIPLLLGVYLLRRKLDLTAVGFALFGSALLLHDLGAYGFYQKSPTPPVSFDMYVHFYFAFVGGFILQRALRNHLPWKPWQVRFTTLLFIMGIGAIHEIMEYSTFLVLGEERGMLKPSTSYRFDNERDLMCNLGGCLAALLIATVSDWVRPNDNASAKTE